MERSEVVYRISADASVDGISAYEVANAMYAFADLVNEAIRETEGDKGRLDVNVRPFRQGSFVTEFVLTYAADVVTLFSSQEATALANTLAILGFGKRAKDSVASVVRKVKGRIDRFVENPDGTFSYGDGENEAVVDEKTHKIIQSPRIARAFKAVTVGPLLHFGDNNVTITIGQNDAGALGQVFDKDDIPTLETYEKTAVEGPPEDEAEEVVSQMNNVVLFPRSGPYDGSDRRYSFKMDESIITNVQMLDAAFRAKLDSGEIRLMGKDCLIVNMEKTQSIRANGKVHASYAITEIVDYRPYKAVEQLTLGE